MTYSLTDMTLFRAMNPQQLFITHTHTYSVPHLLLGVFLCSWVGALEEWFLTVLAFTVSASAATDGYVGSRGGITGGHMETWCVCKYVHTYVSVPEQ